MVIGSETEIYRLYAGNVIKAERPDGERFDPKQTPEECLGYAIASSCVIAFVPPA